jgi:transcriptional regulator with XRE-family HTH domain
MATLTGLGEYLKEQRNFAQMSIRQLAEAAGVSNPYLSQIERGLRRPSAEILQQIAKALRISAEQLYVRAGILDQKEDADLAFGAALLADPGLTDRQKRVLLDIYDTFRRENAIAEDAGAQPGARSAGPRAAGPQTPSGRNSHGDEPGPEEDDG